MNAEFDLIHKLKTLVDRDVPSKILSYLNQFRLDAEGLARDLKHDIIPVIPRFSMNLKKQLNLFECEIKNKLDFHKIRNEEKIFLPYYLLGVDLGQDKNYLSPQDCVNQHMFDGRLPLYLEEVIALILHNHEFARESSFKFAAMGSCYSKGEERGVPIIYFDKTGALNLTWDYNFNQNNDLLTPLFGMRYLPSVKSANVLA